jgi:heme a synthase
MMQEPAHEHAVPRVSPYRLAAHLTSAFAIYTTLLWTTLGVAVPGPLSATAGAVAAKAAAALRHRALPLSALIGVTAVSGAFVAGGGPPGAWDAWAGGGVPRAWGDAPLGTGHVHAWC